MSEPTDGERARIRVTGDNGMFVRAFPERTCVDYWAPNAGVVLGQIGRGIPGFKGRSLGMPNPPKDPRTAAEFYVEAGKPVTLSFWKRDREGECDVSLTFTPQADKDYEGSMTVLYSIKASKKICVPVVLSLSDPGERVPHTIAGECTRPGARTVGDQSAGAPASGTEPARSP